MAPQGGSADERRGGRGLEKETTALAQRTPGEGVKTRTLPHDPRVSPLLRSIAWLIDGQSDGLWPSQRELEVEGGEWKWWFKDQVPP